MRYYGRYYPGTATRYSERTLAAGCKVSLQRSACVRVGADMLLWFDIQSGVKQRCETNGLSINESNTKVLAFERNEEKTEWKISVNGKILEQLY